MSSKLQNGVMIAIDPILYLMQCTATVHSFPSSLFGPFHFHLLEESGNPHPVAKRFPEPEGNLEGGEDGFSNTSRVLVEYGHSRIINPSTGTDQEILPCGQGRIDSVKINPSLLMMRD